MSLKIAILGAGIAGLTTAILLRQQGISVTIYEKRANIAPLGGGLGIWPNGTQVLLQLPCAEKIRKLTANIIQDNFATHDGKLLAQSSRNLFLQINGYPVLNFCRSELQQVLLDEWGNENIIFNAKCTAIEQNENDARLNFADGSFAKADLIIGADGIHSIVRKYIEPSALQYAGYINLAGIIKNSGTYSFKNHFIFGKNRYCLQFPISNNRHIIYFVLPFTQHVIKNISDKNNLIKLFRGWSNEADHILDAFTYSLAKPDFASYFYCNEMYHSPILSRWHNNRLVLVGDAAHAMGSIMGLATGIALEGSQTLVKCLLENQLDDALTLYESQQQPRALALQKLEEEFSQFILHADDDEYQNYISYLKNSSAEKYNERLIKALG